MAAYTFERLSNGKVKITKDGNVIYINGDAIVDPEGAFVRIAPVDSPSFSIVLSQDTITNNGVSLAGQTAAQIAEALSTGTFFKQQPDADSLYLLGIQAMGSLIKGQTLGVDLNQTSTTANLTDGTMVFVAVWLNKSSIITGVKFFQGTQGSYTADNNNKVGLYSYSGGVLTLVASSANNGNLFKAATNSMQTEAFSAPYSAAKGLYFVGLLYNSSAQTTAPALGAGYNTLANAQTADLTNSAKIVGTLAAQTDLPASQNMSGITGVNVRHYAAIY